MSVVKNMVDIINIPEEYREYIRPERRTIEKNDRIINTYFFDLTLSQKEKTPVVERSA